MSENIQKGNPSVSPLKLLSPEYLITASFILSFYGILYTFVYYKQFGVDITSYIELGESLILFISQLPKISLFFLTYGGATLFLFPPINNTKGINYYISSPGQGIYSMFFKDNKLHPKTITIFFISALSVSTGSILYFYLSANPTPHISLSVPLGFFSIFSPFYLILFQDKVKKRWPLFHKPQISRIIYLLFIFTWFVIFFALSNYSKVVRNRTFTQTSITFNDGNNFLSDSSKVYIGKTKNFIFTFDINSKQVNIIPFSQVTKISFKPIPRWLDRN